MSPKYDWIAQDPDQVSTLTRGQIEELLEEVEKRFEAEPNLIELTSGTAVFVGDTHGDFQASKSVIARYLRPENKVVFLGDYVDRGPESRQNINYLLSLKLTYPQNLFLLMGNHEAHSVLEFYPADFWQQLDLELYQRYARVLARLPLAAIAQNGLIALHGALPEVEEPQDINEIELGTEAWRQITWGDWEEGGGQFLGDDLLTGRPQFGQGYFDEMIARLRKNVLIRSHQPTAPPVMYNRRCLTIFTSSAYRTWVTGRTIAIVDLEKEVKTIDDVRVEAV